MPYEQLSPALQKQIQTELSLSAEDTAIRRNADHDKANLWRPPYIRDVEKILHSPYYNRYADKTQVFSFYKNDDLSRRALHVQLVSRIARNIGRLLKLDLDLIEAIALGHDIGHTPFGHAGERFLNDLYHQHTGRYFNHNVHSVRVLDGIFHLNISLQTLDGILCHNGAFVCRDYAPCSLTDFNEFDQKTEACYTDPAAIKKLIPCTLEGCVVRLCDMIAYVGKDRQDAVKTRIIEDESIFEDTAIGKFNAAIINNMIVNIVENSYGKNAISLDEDHYYALKSAKNDNFKFIYQNKESTERYDTVIRPMFDRLYHRLLEDLKKSNKNSEIFRHHIEFVESYNRYYHGPSYRDTEPNQIVTDYIASMTDDYFLDLHRRLFPDEPSIEYISYFA